MDVISPKKIEKKKNEEDRLTKLRTLKTLREFDKVRKSFIEFKEKIEESKNKIKEDYFNFSDEINQKRENLLIEMKRVEERSETVLQPLRDKEKDIDKKTKKLYGVIKEKNELENNIKKNSERNEKILKYITEINDDNEIKIRNAQNEIEKMENERKSFKKQLIEFNNLKNNTLAFVNKKNKELDDREIGLRDREIIAENKIKYCRLERKRLEKMKKLIDDRRSLLNRAEQEIHGRRKNRQQ